MEKKKNNSYFIVPILGLILTIALLFFFYGTYSRTELIEEYDITGMTNGYTISIVVLNVIVLVFALYKLKTTSDGNWAYEVTPTLAVLFAGLALYSIIAFAVVRGQEESISEKVDIPEVFYLDMTSDNIEKEMIKQIETFQNDKYSSRKFQIHEQMEKTSEFDRYYTIFTSWFLFGDDMNITSEETYYYSVFSKYFLLDVILCAFYIFHLSDEEKAKSIDILMKEDI